MTLTTAATGSIPAQAAGPLRVLVVAHTFLPNVGGTERHVAEVIARHRAAGHEVTVLTVDETGRLAGSETFGGVPVQRVRAYPTDRDWKFAPGLAAAIREAHARTGFDLMHLQGYQTFVAPVALAAARRAGLPTVVTFHSGCVLSGLRAKVMQPVQNALLRGHLQRASALIAVSEFEADRLAAELRLPRQKFTVVPNGADLPPVPAGVVRDQAAPLVVSLGRLERYKGHHRLIAALPYLREVHPGLRLRICGSGPYEAELTALADSLGVADAVQIAGVASTDRPGMAGLLASASAVALLSDYESQGIAAYEALGVGTPVVVSDSTALAELVTAGVATGVSDPDDPFTVAAAVSAAVNRGPAAPAAPSWDDCAAGVLGVYASVLAASVPVGASR